MAEEEQQGQDTEKQEKEKGGEEEKPIDKMTATELRDIAKEIPGVTGVHAMRKAELLNLVKEHKSIETETPSKKKVSKKKKVRTSAKELKEKIRQLKAEKQAARDVRDWKKVDILRRRINRSKKLTRKVAGG